MFNSYTMICPPVRGDNTRALASDLSPVQAEKPWYNCSVPAASVQTWLSMKYFVLKFACFGKSRHDVSSGGEILGLYRYGFTIFEEKNLKNSS